jgi:nucleotide-binding universal stress UspA family protein
MEKLLKQLLVVVDFSDKSRQVLDSIIPMANELKCDIHLLYIVQPSVLPFTINSHQIIAVKSDQIAWATSRMMALQGEYIPLMDKGRFIYSHVAEGGMERTIRTFTMKHEIDLAILTYRRRFAWSKWLNRININRLTKKIQCPILNIPESTSIHHIRNIVLPVTNVLPLRKIMFASYLAQYHDARIHLVALKDNSYLYKSYQLLRDNTDLAIECHPVSGENIANTTLQYAESVKADLIVVQPGKEAELPGILNSIFSRFLFSASRIPVMAV